MKLHLPILALVTLSMGCEIHLSSGDSGPQPPVIASADATSRASAVIELAPTIDSWIEFYEISVLDGPGGNTLAVQERSATATYGSAERLAIGGIRPGVANYLSVRAVDVFGNRSEPSVVGPVITDFQTSGAIFPSDPESGDNALGYQVVSGDFNRDGFSDLVVATPFRAVDDRVGAGAISLYFGTADGIASRAGLTIGGDESYAQFGNALATLDWNDDGVLDIAVGSPFANGGHGGVEILGGAALARSEVRVLVSFTSDGQGWFADAALGFALVALDLNGDGAADLAMSAVNAGAEGGVVVAFGNPSVDGEIVVGEDSQLPAQLSVARLRAPIASNLYGISLANAGKLKDGRGEALAIAGFQGDTVVVMRGVERPTERIVTDVAWSSTRDLAVHSTLPADAYFGAALGAIVIDDESQLLIGAHRASDGAGLVASVPLTHSGNVELDDIADAIVHGLPGSQFGSAIAKSGSSQHGDVDGDGLADLVIVGGDGEVELFIWYGDALPHGDTDASSAAYSLSAPIGMQGQEPTIGGSPATASWVGDVDNDGLDDLAWADWTGNARDGLFELLR